MAALWQSVKEIVGFGLFWSWFDMVVMGGLINNFNDIQGATQTTLATSLFFGSITLCLFAFRSRLFYSLFFDEARKPWALVVTACLAGLGGASTVTMASSELSAIGLLGSMLEGLGMSSLFLVWASHIIEKGPKQTAVCISGAFGMALLFDIVSFLVPFSIAFATMALFPLLSVLMFNWCTSEDRVTVEHEESFPILRRSNETIELFGIDAKFILSLILINFALGFALCQEAYSLNSSDRTSLLFYIMRGSTAALFFLTILISNGRSLFHFTRIGLFAMMGGALCLLSYESSGILGLFGISTFSAGFVCFDIFTWVILAELSFYSKRPKIQVFSGGQSFVYLSMSLGLIASDCLQKAAATSSGDMFFLQIVILAIVYCLIVGSALVFDNDNGIWTRLKYRNVDQISSWSIDFDAAVELCGREAGLTSREIEVAKQLAAGKSYTHISKTLYISVNTTKSHVKSIYAKFDIHSKEDLVHIIESHL